MMLLYNIGIRLYLCLIRIGSLFNDKASLWLRGRKDWRKDIGGRLSKDDRVIWVHCASLGEFEQGRPIIELIKKREPGTRILLSFFSPSGYEVRKDYELADHVMYLPADTPANARHFISSVSPVAAIFIKYEFWYNYLSVLQKRGIPHYLASGIFREKQLFFRWYGRRFLRILKGFTTIFVQSGESEKLLRKNGIDRVQISGDTRFDRVFDISRKSPGLEVLDKFCGDKKAIIAGSTWPAEEEILCRYINNSKDIAKWVIAPHEIGEDHIAAIESKLKVKHIRYSHAMSKSPVDYDVLIIDNIGLLSSIYRYGNLAVIGGGFGRGIHNILEPSSWGLPVLFGPRYQKFKEALDLLSAGGAFTFNSYDQFTTIFEDLRSKDESLREASDRSSEYVKKNLGASAIVVDNIL